MKYYLLALLSALYYRFPSRQIRVVAVTGTKGKSTTVELIGTILEEAGYRVALSSTVRFKIGEHSENNLFKMTMPGRGFLQHFLRRSVRAGCEYAVIEMTSEGARQSRHKFIELDAFIFTNLTPEHIESHGSYEAYRQAKLDIAQALVGSRKPARVMVINGDDQEAPRFLALEGPEKMSFHLKQLEPITTTERGTEFVFENVKMVTKLPGRFNLHNLLAAMTFARSQGISLEIIKEAVEKFGGVRGRMEPVGWQDFRVIVDYAHTPDSLRQVYETFPRERKIAVLGGTGGGRDKWKRPLMGQIAAEYCDLIILTNEDPYDERPEQIIQEIAAGIKNKDYKIILDRRLAIREALRQVCAGDVVLITGKGTDPYICGPRGSKIPWSDAAVAHEELERLKAK